MNIFKKPWFKAKTYGWGWYPATWQGWAVFIIYILYITNRIFAVDEMFDTTTSFMWRYTFEFLFATSILIAISYVAGEKPGWRWGGKNKKRSR